MQKGKHARENRCVRLTGSCTRVSGVYCYFSFIFILYYHTGEYIISLKCLIYMWRARWLTCWRLVRILTSNNDALYLIPTVCDNLINYRIIIIIIIIINHAARSKCSKMFTDKLDCTTSLSPRLFSKCTAMSHKSGVRHTHTQMRVVHCMVTSVCIRVTGCCGGCDVNVWVRGLRDNTRRDYYASCEWATKPHTSSLQHPASTKQQPMTFLSPSSSSHDIWTSWCLPLVS